jgi:ABC-type glycerol-3-phosphate transport system substrate-binding protein
MTSFPSSREKIQVEAGGKTHIYGVDVCTVGPVLYYNKDMFDAAHVPYPPTDPAQQWTWDQFVGYMKQLTKVVNGKTTQYGTANFEEGMNLYTTQEMLASNGTAWFNADPSVNGALAVDLYCAGGSIRRAELTLWELDVKGLFTYHRETPG